MGLVDELVQAIGQRRGGRGRFTVAVDGPDAAGKSTLATELTAALGPGTVHTSVDAFHHPKARRHSRGRMSPQGYYRDTFDHPTLISDLLAPFQAGARRVCVASHDYDSDAGIDERVEIADDAILVVDGVFLQTPTLRPFWDLTVYLRISPQLSLERGTRRDAEVHDSLDDLETLYRERYLPGQVLYRDECDPEALADLLVDTTDVREPRMIRGL